MSHKQSLHSPNIFDTEQIKRSETPIDLTSFFKIKDQKRENKQLITIWYSEFERNNKRKPTDGEAMREIKGMLDDRTKLVGDFTTMKSKLIN